MSGLSESELNAIKDEISRHFLDLTVVEGLSVMEALCFSLVRIKGMSPLDASEIVSAMTGKEVGNFRVSVYVDRGRRKLLENNNFVGDGSTGEMIFR